MTKHLLAGVAALAFISTAAEAAPTFATGAAPVDTVFSYGTRYRAFRNGPVGEVYAGFGDLGVAANRTQALFNWTQNADNSITLEYAPASGVRGSGNANTTAFKTGAAPAELNVLQISVKDDDAGGSLSLSNLLLNGDAIDGAITISGAQPAALASITGFDFTQAFTLTGTLNLSGAFGISQEAAKIDLQVGYSEELAEVPEPAALGLLGLGVLGLAAARRRRA